MMIDAHQHVWRLDRGDYGWLDLAPPSIRRDFGPGDLAPLLDRHGIGATILVQAAATLAETAYLLDVAGATPWIAGVIGWADFAEPDAPQTIAALAANPLLVGLRPMIQDLADDDWLMRHDLGGAFKALIEHGIVFDALVLPRHLSRLLVMLDRQPGLSVVVDHGAKPFIREGRLDPWRADMAAVAARPNTTCKLSGLVTEAADDWSADDLRPYVDHLLAVFGARRLIWGSDWPVVNLAGGFDRWREASLALIAELSAGERSAILGGNAARVYLHSRGRS